jgi:hypothetical protein
MEQDMARQSFAVEASHADSWNFHALSIDCSKMHSYPERWGFGKQGREILHRIFAVASLFFL